MDSLTHVALGAAVGMAVLRRRTAPWKAALWGAVAGTLPDLDVLVDHGDPILDMVLHRAESHALFWLTLASPLLTALVVAVHREQAHWRAWWLALWLALVTHPLLDALTVYGTQLALPFSNRPFGVGSVFIIDPLVTLPWLAGAAWALAARGSTAGLRANAIGLALGGAYLAWGLAAQAIVTQRAQAALQPQGIVAERLLVTPAAFSSLLWRVVAVSGAQYHEGFHSLLDAPEPIAFDRFERGAALDEQFRANADVQRIRDFSRGLYKLHAAGERVVVADLRMGVEPDYTFAFAVAERGPPPRPLAPPQAVGRRPDLVRAWPWLWRRTLGDPLPPPR
ncbi:MAG: metal-dependent hydrolase [Proteobacteria bacterium]|nr:metal-dependent hydrolase [Pseudomonadota bacterium]